MNTAANPNEKQNKPDRSHGPVYSAPLSAAGRWRRFLLSLAFNIGMMLLLFHLFDPVFEGNDDVTIVQFVNGACGSFDPHLVYQNYLLGVILSFLYRSFPLFPWYSWMQFLALCAAFTAITFVLSCRIRRAAGFALALLVQSFAAYECYINLQYTKTAGVLAAGGMFLLWHGLWGREKCTEVFPEDEAAGSAVQPPRRICLPGRILWGSVSMGIVLCVWSICYRYVQFAACAALTAGIPLLMLLDTVRRKRQQQTDRKDSAAGLGSVFLRCLLAGAVLGCILAGLVRFDRSMYERDPQWKNYVEYNNTRSELMDYGMTKFEGHEDLYAELGISRTAYDLFDTWNSGDTAVFSTEVMRRLADAREQKRPGFDTLKDFAKEVPEGFMENRLFRCLLVAAALWILFGRHDGRAVLALLLEAALFLVLYYYLFLQGRYLYNRVDVGLWMSVLLVLLWTWKQESPRRPVNVMRALVILGVMALCVFVQIPGWKGRLAKNNGDGRSRRAQTRVMMEQISGDTQHLYVSKIGILSASRFSAPFEPMPQGILSNVVTLGGWKVESVPFNAALQAHGFKDNPYEAIAGTTAQSENVYLLDNDLDATLAYLREYYNPDAAAVEAGEWNGETLWRIVSDSRVH